jgi:hypothetical protein
MNIGGLAGPPFTGELFFRFKIHPFINFHVALPFLPAPLQAAGNVLVIPVQFINKGNAFLKWTLHFACKSFILRNKEEIYREPS